MDTPSQAQDLRDLLAVARKLRGLAEDVQTREEDAELFQVAAAALEARAKWQANSLPEDRYEPAAAMQMHQPVNLLV